MQGLYTSAVCIYDPRQLPGVDTLLHDLPPGGVLLSLDAEVDRALKDRNIPHLSARAYKVSDTSLFLQAEKAAACIEDKSWDWFSYRGISFGRLFVPTLQSYFVEAFYFVGIFNAFLDAHPELKKITVLPPAQAIPAAGAFIARRQIYAVADCARLVALQRRVEIVVPEPVLRTPLRRAGVFTILRLLWNAALGLLNALVSAARPRARVRILVSDYWRHVASVLPRIPGAEVVMYDRQEAFNAGLQNIWKYRMRFMSAANFSVKGRQSERAKALQSMIARWDIMRASVGDSLYVRRISLAPLIADMLDEVIRMAMPLQLEEVDRIYAMIEAMRPDVVMLRATVSQQWHFPLLALVAKACGVPSFELLHGMEYPGPGSVDKRHVAEYLGVYGLHTQRQMIAAGFPERSLPVVGSPRFDQYALQARVPSGGTRVFCAVPDLFTGVTFDTYDVEAYFQGVAAATHSIPGISVLLKMRPGPRRETFYRRAIAEAFTGIPHTIAQYEPLGELFAQSDIAISCQSTVTLEAMQCGVPLVLYAATPVERMMLEYNFSSFAAEGAAVLCTNAEALSAELGTLARDSKARAALCDKGSAFLKREFAFDGKASERTAGLVEALATKGAVD